MAVLTVSNVCRQERGEYILHPISFTLPAAGRLAIAGETGSGKTTLLKIIAGLVQPAEGTVFIDDEKVLGPDEKLIPGHPRIGYLSQHFELRNNYRVEEELESKNLLDEEEANLIYHLCQINHLLKRKTTELSGGERQRIVLARLLTTKPSLLLLDEPFSNLDRPHKQTIKQILDDVHSRLGISCITVSHDAADLLPWAGEMLILKEGKLVQSGSTYELYNQPVNEYCAALLGDYNMLPAALAVQLLAGSNIRFKKNELIVRPEHLTITNKGLACTIISEAFYGSHYILTTQHQQHILKVYSKEHKTAIGDTIFLTATPDKIKML